MPVIKLKDGNHITLPENPTEEQKILIQKIFEDSAEQPKAPSRNLMSTEPAKVLDKAIRGGFLSWPGMMMDAGTWLASKVDKNLLGRNLDKDVKWPSDMMYEMTGGPLSKPETPVGKSLGNIGESVIGTMATGGFNKINALMGLSSGVGAEAAGQISDNPLARFLGGLIGGAGYGLFSSLKPNEKEIIQGSLGHLKPSEIEEAKTAGKILAEKKMPYLNSQLFPNTSSLSDEVSLATGNPTARPEFLRIVGGDKKAGLPAVKDAMIADLQGKVKDLFPPQILSLKGRRSDFLEIQKRAKDLEVKLLDEANRAFTRHLPKETLYNEAKMTTIADDILAMANSAKHKGGKGQNNLIAFVNQHFPVTMTPDGKMVRDSMSNVELNNKIKDLNQLTYDPSWSGLAVEDLKKYLKSVTPEFDLARQAKRKVMSEVVAPYRQSLAGTIAQMGGGPNENKYTVTKDIGKMVFANTPQPNEIKELGKHLGPDALSTILKDYLSQNLMKVLKPSSGPEWQAPARFVDEVMGTQAQQQNIKAALRVIGKDMHNTGDLLKAYKEILHGYGTYRNLKIKGVIDEATSDAKASFSLGSVVIAPHTQGSRFVRESTMAKTHKALADLMTNPANFDKIVAIGKEKVPSRKSALIRSLLFNLDTTGSDSE